MAAVEHKTYTGKCYCGAVEFSARDLKDIWFCHCTQCRSLTGHYMAACRALSDDVAITGSVKWTAVSAHAEHGFCSTCCSPLFWRSTQRSTISIVPASLETSDGIETKGHVFVSEKGDYYEIADGLPQYDTYPEGWTQ